MQDTTNKIFLILGIVITAIFSVLFLSQDNPNPVIQKKHNQEVYEITPEIKKLYFDMKYKELKEEWKRIKAAGLDKYPYTKSRNRKI